MNMVLQRMISVVCALAALAGMMVPASWAGALERLPAGHEPVSFAAATPHGQESLGLADSAKRTSAARPTSFLALLSHAQVLQLNLLHHACKSCGRCCENAAPEPASLHNLNCLLLI